MSNLSFLVDSCAGAGLLRLFGAGRSGASGKLRSVFWLLPLTSLASCSGLFCSASFGNTPAAITETISADVCFDLFGKAMLSELCPVFFYVLHLRVPALGSMADVETGPHDLTAHISKWAQNAFCHFGLTLVLSGMMAARASVVS